MAAFPVVIPDPFLPNNRLALNGFNFLFSELGVDTRIVPYVSPLARYRLSPSATLTMGCFRCVSRQITNQATGSRFLATRSARERAYGESSSPVLPSAPRKRPRQSSDHTEFSMLAVAAKEALDEAGMTLKDVDALFTNYMGEKARFRWASIWEYALAMPNPPIWAAPPEFFVHHAMLAVPPATAVALIGYASRQRSRRGTTRRYHRGQFASQFGHPTEFTFQSATTPQRCAPHASIRHKTGSYAWPWRRANGRSAIPRPGFARR